MSPVLVKGVGPLRESFDRFRDIGAECCEMLCCLLRSWPWEMGMS